MSSWWRSASSKTPRHLKGKEPVLTGPEAVAVYEARRRAAWKNEPTPEDWQTVGQDIRRAMRAASGEVSG